MSSTRKTRFTSSSPTVHKAASSSSSEDSDYENVAPNNDKHDEGSPSPDDVGNTTIFVDPRDIPTAPCSPAATEWQGSSSHAPVNLPTIEQMSVYWQALQGELVWLRERVQQEERVWSTLEMTLETVRERGVALAPFHKRHTDLLDQLERLRFLDVTAGLYTQRR